jgi:hypothetical protein
MEPYSRRSMLKLGGTLAAGAVAGRAIPSLGAQSDATMMQGPLALFAVGDRFLPFTRRDLSAVRQVAPRSAEWRASTVDGEQIFKPYFAVNRETTRLYQPVAA